MRSIIFSPGARLISCSCLLYSMIAGKPAQGAVPRITSISPSTASVGATISITGENFSPDNDANIVWFGSVRASVTAANSTNLNVKVPSGATVARIAVTVNGLTASASQPFLPSFKGDASGVSSNTFAAAFNLPAGHGPVSIVLADIDNDGRPDLVVANGYGFSIRVFRNIGTNASLSADSFAAPVDFPSPTAPGSPGTNPYKLTVADVDGDGKLDLVASGVSVDQIAIWRNTSTPGIISTDSFAAPVLLQAGSDCRFARAADVDGDGRLDIITANYGGGTVSILKNIGSPGSLGQDSFAPRFDLQTGSGPYELDVADLDGDGRPDIAVVNTGSSISLIRNVCTNGVLDTNAFETPVQIPAPSNASSISIADVDGDGRPDIVAGFVQPLKIDVYRNLMAAGPFGSNSFASPVEFSTGNWVHNVAFGDFDGDGKPDIATDGELPSYACVFANLSTPGSFGTDSLGPRLNLASGWNAWGLAIGDLDEDGRPDLVFANSYDDTITLYRNTAPFAGPPAILSPPASQFVATGNPVNFSVLAAGSAELAYQWFKDNTTLTGATARSFTIVSAQPVDTGEYFVVVTNVYGAATSSVAQLSVSNVAPYIIAQPLNRGVPVNGSVEFSVVAGGSKPMTYQWLFNGTNLPGATASVLTLANVQLSQAGTYAVEVSNSVDSILSSNATLTVYIPPAVVAIPDSTNTSGWPVTLPVLLAANGNENAVSFSINFATPTRAPLLRFREANVGQAAQGASVVVNTNQLSSGFLGLAIALPAGSTFSAGTQEIATVSFDTPVITFEQLNSQLLVFSDSPIQRQLTDAGANSIPVLFSPGRAFLLPAELEGDVSPRPGGNKSITLNDWVQAGRFAAGLDTPAPGPEFQRADCAPRETRGDGLIKVTDWVQAGRYFGKLDPLEALGGPSAPVPAIKGADGGPVNGPNLRTLKIADATAVEGVPVQVAISLNSQGDENAVGFTLTFDDANLQFNSAAAGVNAGGAALNINAAQRGKLGLALALPTGAAFSSGVREIARVTFVPKSTFAGNCPVAFANAPVYCAVSDAVAAELPADYVPGNVSVIKPPELSISASNGQVMISWPLWAADFVLQTSSDSALSVGSWTNVSAPVLTNDAALLLSVPVTGNAQFFRLQH